jgi:hypothetical protein
MTTVCFQVFCISSAMARPKTSTKEPGMKGTTSRMGLLGYALFAVVLLLRLVFALSCAKTDTAQTNSIAQSPTIRVEDRFRVRMFL